LASSSTERADPSLLEILPERRLGVGFDRRQAGRAGDDRFRIFENPLPVFLAVCNWSG
jgi:hypothetical protein